jgi:hypothetical protein
VTDVGAVVVSRAASDIPAGEIAHAFKPTIFSGEVRYVLERDTLIRYNGRTEEHTPLTDIVRIRLYAVPSGTGPSLRRTVLSLRSGRKLILQSNSFVRFGVTEDRGESYRRIVQTLMQRIPAANPQVEVIVGPSTALWAFWLIALIGSGIVLAAGALLVAMGDFPLSAALYFGLVVAYVPLGWRVVASGRSRRADPMHLPRTLFMAE